MQSKRVGFEVNTSLLRRGMQQPMPEERIMRALNDEGVNTVTVGSDAHEPINVGKGIEVALEMIRNSGFEGPSIYRKRKSTVVRWSEFNTEKQN
jgi:histidinol-phosphatase (PHP family)